MPFNTRLYDQAKALNTARQLTEASRRYNRERIQRKANAKEVKIGDSVVIKVNEPMTFTSRWDPEYIVIAKRGPVCWIRHQPTRTERVVNRNKLIIVDPEMCWEGINERPRQIHDRALRVHIEREVEEPGAGDAERQEIIVSRVTPAERYEDEVMQITPPLDRDEPE